MVEAHYTGMEEEGMGEEEEEGGEMDKEEEEEEEGTFTQTGTAKVPPTSDEWKGR